MACRGVTNAQLRNQEDAAAHATTTTTTTTTATATTATATAAELALECLPAAGGACGRERGGGLLRVMHRGHRGWLRRVGAELKDL